MNKLKYKSVSGGIRSTLKPLWNEYIRRYSFCDDFYATSAYTLYWDVLTDICKHTGFTRKQVISIANIEWRF